MFESGDYISCWLVGGAIEIEIEIERERERRRRRRRRDEVGAHNTKRLKKKIYIYIKNIKNFPYSFNHKPFLI